MGIKDTLTPQQKEKLYWYNAGSYGDPVYPVGGTGFKGYGWGSGYTGKEALEKAGWPINKTPPSPWPIPTTPEPPTPISIGGGPYPPDTRTKAGYGIEGGGGWIGPPLQRRVPTSINQRGVEMKGGQVGQQTPQGQPLMDPYAYFSGSPTGGYFAGQTAPGYDPSQLPRLRIPSMQTWARMGPQFQQQYMGYRQAQTGAIPEQSYWNIMHLAPPSQKASLTYRR